MGPPPGQHAIRKPIEVPRRIEAQHFFQSSFVGRIPFRDV